MSEQAISERSDTKLSHKELCELSNNYFINTVNIISLLLVGMALTMPFYYEKACLILVAIGVAVNLAAIYLSLFLDYVGHDYLFKDDNGLLNNPTAKNSALTPPIIAGIHLWYSIVIIGYSYTIIEMGIPIYTDDLIKVYAGITAISLAAVILAHMNEKVLNKLNIALINEETK
ncbi:hypothetical protein SOX05_08760 [Pseudomonas putida]|nr:hypothetical protein [Pseudomonas putida]MDY4319352.1 hypothetical protein [Pseudomonas putida]MDY4352737.1 hypothetical protein [Pseudomonas putida]